MQVTDFYTDTVLLSRKTQEPKKFGSLYLAQSWLTRAKKTVRDRTLLKITTMVPELLTKMVISKRLELG